METLPPVDIFPRIPEELKELDQWVLWTYENDTKVPKNPRTGGNSGVNWANTWGSYEDTVFRGAERNLGIGFVLTPEDPYTVIDLDHCWRKGQPLDERTRTILDLLSGYTEASPSLTGLHIWIRSEIPVNRRTSGIEVYSFGRWMTCTGRANPQAPTVIPDRTAELQELIGVFFPDKEYTLESQRQPVPLEDKVIWGRLFNSRNGATFTALFNGDVSVTHNDHSRGVIFLANMLAMMLDGDAPRMKQLLYQTGLVNDKWEERRGNRTWLDHQVEDAILWARGKKK